MDDVLRCAEQALASLRAAVDRVEAAVKDLEAERLEAGSDPASDPADDGGTWPPAGG